MNKKYTLAKNIIINVNRKEKIKMDHPIEDIMKTTMNSLKDMIDVNTIIGSPIETKNNTVIIPISKVCFTFASGGSDFKGETINEYTKREKDEIIQYRLPFGGGSGAGVCIKPVAFLIVSEDTTKLLPVDYNSTVDKLIDYIPDIVEKGNEVIKCMKDKNKCINDLKQKIEKSLKKDMEDAEKQEEKEKEDIPIENSYENMPE